MGRTQRHAIGLVVGGTLGAMVYLRPLWFAPSLATDYGEPNQWAERESPKPIRLKGIPDPQTDPLMGSNGKLSEQFSAGDSAAPLIGGPSASELAVAAAKERARKHPASVYAERGAWGIWALLGVAMAVGWLATAGTLCAIPKMFGAKI